MNSKSTKMGKKLKYNRNKHKPNIITNPHRK